MAGRKIKDETEAVASLDAVARTGLELVEWCRARDVDARSLIGWRHVLTARGYQPPEDVRFVELVRAPATEEAPARRYSVHLGAFCVEVDDKFDDETLGRLLRVVAAC